MGCGVCGGLRTAARLSSLMAAAPVPPAAVVSTVRMCTRHQMNRDTCRTRNASIVGYNNIQSGRVWTHTDSLTSNRCRRCYRGRRSCWCCCCCTATLVLTARRDACGRRLAGGYASLQTILLSGTRRVAAATAAAVAPSVCACACLLVGQFWGREGVFRVVSWLGRASRHTATAAGVERQRSERRAGQAGVRCKLCRNARTRAHTRTRPAITSQAHTHAHAHAHTLTHREAQNL